MNTFEEYPNVKKLLIDDANSYNGPNNFLYQNYGKIINVHIEGSYKKEYVWTHEKIINGKRFQSFTPVEEVDGTIDVLDSKIVFREDNFERIEQMLKENNN